MMMKMTMKIIISSVSFFVM